MVKKITFRKILIKHFDPTDKSLQKVRSLFIGQIDKLLIRASRPKGKAEARKLCQAIYKLLQTKEFKTTKASDRIYAGVWKKFENTCGQFIRSNEDS